MTFSLDLGWYLFLTPCFINFFIQKKCLQCIWISTCSLHLFRFTVSLLSSFLMKKVNSQFRTVGGQGSYIDIFPWSGVLSSFKVKITLIWEMSPVLTYRMDFLLWVMSLSSAHGPTGIQSSHCPQRNIHTLVACRYWQTLSIWVMKMKEFCKQSLGKKPKAEGNTNFLLRSDLSKQKATALFMSECLAYFHLPFSLH